MSARDRILRHEGIRASVYEDSLGFWTIGVGHLVDSRKGGKLPQSIIDALLDHDLTVVMQQLDQQIPWWRGRSDGTKEVLIDMAFQLGITGLLEFQKFLTAIHAGDYETAIAELKNSKLYTEAKERCDDNILSLN